MPSLSYIQILTHNICIAHIYITKIGFRQQIYKSRHNTYLLEKSILRNSMDMNNFPPNRRNPRQIPTPNQAMRPLRQRNTTTNSQVTQPNPIALQVQSYLLNTTYSCNFIYKSITDSNPIHCPTRHKEGGSLLSLLNSPSRIFFPSSAPLSVGKMNPFC